MSNTPRRVSAPHPLTPYEALDALPEPIRVALTDANWEYDAYLVLQQFQKWSGEYGKASAIGGVIMWIRRGDTARMNDAELNKSIWGTEGSPTSLAGLKPIYAYEHLYA